MKKIPYSYKQKHDITDIIKFIDKFKFLLSLDLKKFYSLLEYNPQVVSNKNSFLFKERFISFDNMNDNQIYNILEFNDYELIKLLHNTNLDNGLINFYSAIERDKKNSFKKVIAEQKLLLMKRILLVQANDETIIRVAKEIIRIINENIKKIDLHDTNKIPLDFKVYSFKKIRKMYPTISINDAINELVSSKSSVLVFDIDNTFEHINRKEMLSFYKNATLYVKSEINNKSIEIFNFYICPKLEEVLSKYQYDIDIMNNTEELSKIFNGFNDLLSIEINFSRILMYILNQIHICEITNGPFDEETEKEFKNNKLFRI